MQRRAVALVAAVIATTGLSGCAGGSSDVVGGPAAGEQVSAATLDLYGFAVAKPAFDVLVPAFQRTVAGRRVAFHQSYGASGDQSRKVAAGAPADLVALSVEPDVTRLVAAGLVDWPPPATEHHGIPFGSVVTLVVRRGNPKAIRDWDDLLRPGIEVVTPNPFSSGSAKWNLLAPYAAKSHGGRDPAAGLAYLTALLSQHVRLQPTSGREATEAFLQGSGDVLLSYENEALFLERAGEPVERVIPPETIRIENPFAVLKQSRNEASARAFEGFLQTPGAQRLVAGAGFRPVDPAVAREFAADFPAPHRLWTVQDLGGWGAVDRSLFAKDGGAIAAVYAAALR